MAEMRPLMLMVFHVLEKTRKIRLSREVRVYAEDVRALRVTD